MMSSSDIYLPVLATFSLKQLATLLPMPRNSTAAERDQARIKNSKAPEHNVLSIFSRDE